MKESSATDAQLLQFAELARNYQHKQSRRYSALMPYRDGIAELRSKGATFAAITQMLSNVKLEVAPDTVRRFCRDVLEERKIGKPPKRNASSVVKPATPHSGANRASGASGLPLPQQPLPAAPLPASMPADPPRTRGPRIADPSKF